MSLTRDEWCKMWESVKVIEYEMNAPVHLLKKRQIITELDRIKRQIQSVIGQME